MNTVQIQTRTPTRYREISLHLTKPNLKLAKFWGQSTQNEILGSWQISNLQKVMVAKLPKLALSEGNPRVNPMAQRLEMLYLYHLRDHDKYIYFVSTTQTAVYAVRMVPEPFCEQKHNLPHSEFLLSSHQQSILAMNRPIVTFSHTPKSTETTDLQNRPPKSSNFRYFDHPPMLLAGHRDDRCFRAKRIWIQGLPLDPDQAQQILQYAKDQHKLPILDSAIEKMVTHSNSKSNSTSPIVPMIGTTSISQAVLIELDKMVTFSASPIKGNLPTVMELVVRTISKTMIENTTTIVVVPWIIESLGEMVTLLRFHHMAMDAKSELVHAIYHQLEQLTGTQEGPLQQIQFIARIVTANNKPLWVVDLVGPCETSSLEINNHFTGNAAGDAATIVMDGIPMQVIGGYGISAASHQGFIHPPLTWANLPTMPHVSLRYMADIVSRMGCDVEGIVSILYAKAENIRSNSKVRQDRHTLNHKANSQVCPTIIFKSQSSLKYFLDHFAHFVREIFPSQLIGHCHGVLSPEKTLVLYTHEPRSIESFLRGKSLQRYLSNRKKGHHDTLNATKVTMDTECDYFQSVTNLLLIAQRSMDPPTFKKSFLLMVHQFVAMDDSEMSATAMLDTVTLTGSSRSTSVSKRKSSEHGQNAQTRQAEYKRKAEAYAKEREEAELDLDYSELVIS